MSGRWEDRKQKTENRKQNAIRKTHRWEVRVSTKEFSVLLALGAIWGASFMFIKIGGAELQPFALVEIRLGLAALIMLGVAPTQRGILEAMRRNWKPLVVMGLMNCALPYTLL